MREDKRMTAIIFCDKKPLNEAFKKYHNILDTDSEVKKFMKFAKHHFENVLYVNFYSKKTRQFLRRELAKNY